MGKLYNIPVEPSHPDGMTVPEGYFEAFKAKMKVSLPEQEWEREALGEHKAVPKSFWQKVRPYVYMAAMFAGVWCMMKMFDIMKGDGNMSIESRPELVAALGDSGFVEDLNLYDEESYDEFMDDLYNSGVDPSSFDDTETDNETK